MSLLSSLLALLVALEHYYILYLEMFQTSSKTAQKAFELDEEFLADRRVQTLFKNQGLYNGFLATGILWGLFFATDGWSVIVFFVSCVLVAAIYGAVTSSKQILFKQGLPAVLTLLSLLLFK